MSSVLIKGMDMPKNCASCPCGNAQVDYCYAKNKRIVKLDNSYPYMEKRPDWCPLQEVKHGHWDIEKQKRKEEKQTESDLISRKSVIDYLTKNMEMFDAEGHPMGSSGEKRMFLSNLLSGVPSAKPKHGKWISKMVARDGEYAGWICSNCGYFTANSKACFYNYCPDCGAKMREES